MSTDLGPACIEVPLRDRDGAVVAVALLDLADAELAMRRWHLSAQGYAKRNASRSVAGPSIVLLHRAVLGLVHGDGLQADHINGDRLDCRRSNLRACVHAENHQNVPSQSGTSRFRGVCWDAARSRWRAEVRLGGSRHALGRFRSELVAAGVAAQFRADRMPFTNEERAAC